MTQSILDPRLYGVIYITGLYGVGKTTLATTSERPELTAILDFDLKFKAEAERLGFWYRSPGIDGDWTNVDFANLTTWFRQSLMEIPEGTTVVTIDNATSLESLLGYIVGLNPAKYGVKPDNARTGSWGGVNPGIGRLWKNIVQFLQARGVRVIFTVAHIGTPWVGGRPVLNKFRGKGNKTLQELANLSLILIREDSPVPSGLIIKEQFAQRTFIENAWQIRRVLPLRFPVATWPAILSYFEQPADFGNPQLGEVPSPKELSMYGDLFTDAQIEFIKSVANSEFDEDGEPPTAESPKEAPSVPTIESLIAKHGVEAIMNASGGTVPETAEEIRAVAEILKEKRELANHIAETQGV